MDREAIVRALVARRDKISVAIVAMVAIDDEDVEYVGELDLMVNEKRWAKLRKKHGRKAAR